MHFFETKEQAEKFIFETKCSASVELAELAVEEKHILGVIRQSRKFEPRLLLEAWQRFEKEEIDDGNLTVQELVEKSLARQKAQGRSPRTLIDDRSRLNLMTKAIGHIRAGAIKLADILRYIGRDRSGNKPAKPLQEVEEAVALGASSRTCGKRSDGETETFGQVGCKQ